MAYIVGDFRNNPPPPLDGTDNESNQIYGDTDGTISPPDTPARGGNDTLTGGADSDSDNNTLYGDADRMDNDAKGGDDNLTGGADSNNNFLYGDAQDRVMP